MENKPLTPLQQKEKTYLDLISRNEHLNTTAAAELAEILVKARKTPEDLAVINQKSQEFYKAKAQKEIEGLGITN